MRVSLGMAGLAALLAGCMETAPVAVSTSDAPVVTQAPAVAGSGMTALLNQQRAASGLGPLNEDARLSRSAQRHAADMAQNGYFSHQGRNGSRFSERAAADGYGCARAENIYAGTSNPAQVVSGWMASDGHRRNILLSDVTEVGIGQSAGYWVLVLGTGC